MKSEIAQLKRNLFIQLAAIGLVPLIALVFMTVKVGVMAESIHHATTIENLARSARTHYKAFFDGVLEAVDLERLPSKALAHLESAESDLKDLSLKIPEGKQLAELDINLESQFTTLRNDSSIANLMRLRQDINLASSTLDKISNKLENDSSAQVSSLIATSISLRYFLIGLVTVMLLFWILVVRYLIRKLTIPLDAALSACKEVSAGHLNIDTKKLSEQGDLGGLIANIDLMRKKWAEVVSSMHQQILRMRQSSINLTGQVGELEDNAHKQRSAASSIAATMEEMSVNMDLIAKQANQASSHADAGGRLASSSMDVIGRVSNEVKQVSGIIEQAAKSVSELDAKVAGIGTILTVISDVADQTNLLALNAAIEAARAGDAGRGFAVVSEEVRKLADRTNESTQSIGTMIAEMKQATKQIVVSMQASVDSVRHSVELSREATDRMLEVQSMSASISHAIEDVDQALRQQRTSAVEIERKIMSIVDYAERHVASGSTVAESAQLIESAASAINADVSYFKL
jgi:methyl-accepting chemotaxis protein